MPLNGRKGGALQRLTDGFDRFRGLHFDADPELYATLIEGQHPEVLVIACSDSRTDPAIICGAEPGDLFVIRNVAALVPPLWHNVIIKPALKRWDLEFATREERALAAEQNRKAGWPDWHNEPGAEVGRAATVGV